MDPEATLTEIFANFRTITRAEKLTDRFTARDDAIKGLQALADWIDHGGSPPKIMLDGSELVRFPR